MKEPILKAVAMPPRVFWAPMELALANFAVQVGVFFCFFGLYQISPLYLLCGVILGHTYLVIYSKYDPHMSRILSSWGKSPPHFTKSIYPQRGTKLAP